MVELSKKDKNPEEKKKINRQYTSKRIKDIKNILEFRNIVDYRIANSLNQDYYNLEDYDPETEISCYSNVKIDVPMNKRDVYYCWGEKIEKGLGRTSNDFDYLKLYNYIVKEEDVGDFDFVDEEKKDVCGYEDYAHTTVDILKVELDATSLGMHYHIFNYDDVLSYFIGKIYEKAPHAKEIVKKYFIFSHGSVFIPKFFLHFNEYYDYKKAEQVRYFVFRYDEDPIKAIEEYLALSNVLEKEELNRKLAGLRIASTLKELEKISPIQYDSMLDCTLFKVSAFVESLETGKIDYCTMQANSCKNSYCPICERNKAKKKALKVQNFLTENYQDNYYFFLTLTVPNIHYKDFKTTKILYKKTWDDFVKRVLSNNKHFNGYLSTYEISFEEKREDYIHPHSHILLSFSRNDINGKFRKAKKVFNVEKQIEKIRTKWTKYFLSKLKKYHDSKGQIYGIKGIYNSDLMLDYINYQNNFSVDIKTIKENNFENVAFELSHYMFKPSKVNKEDIASSVDNIVSVFDYKIKMYDQVKNMNFTNRGGVFRCLDLEGPDEQHYRVLSRVETQFKNNDFESKVDDLQEYNIQGTRKQLSKNKLFNHRVSEAKRFANELDVLERKNALEEQIRTIQSKIDLNNQILIDKKEIDYNLKSIINQRIADLERHRNEMIYKKLQLTKVHND